MKTAVIYARYSSERQTEQSIEGQMRVCHEYAKENDILIVDHRGKLIMKANRSRVVTMTKTTNTL